MNSERQPIDILKFGGTSVADLEAINQCCEVVDSHVQAGSKVMVVVSAMAGVTDFLHQACESARNGDDFKDPLDKMERKHIGVADSLGEDGGSLKDLIRREIAGTEELLKAVSNIGSLSAKIQDRIVSTGERISPHLLTACLKKRQNVAAVDAGEMIRTDNKFGDASADINATRSQVEKEVVPKLLEGNVVVTGGYYGLTPGGKIATFGRGGSDFTATLLARVFHDLGFLSSVFLYKADVSGVLSGDPRIIENPKVIPHLTKEEAKVLASLGGKVLHQKAVSILNGTRVPIFCRSTKDMNAEGTLIDNDRMSDDSLVSAVTMLYPLRVISITGSGMNHPGVAERVFKVLSDSNINVRAIVQPLTELVMHIIVQDSIDASGITSEIEEALALEKMREDVSAVASSRISAVGIVGKGVNDPAVIDKITHVLHDGAILPEKAILYSGRSGEVLHTILFQGENVKQKAIDATRSLHAVLFEREQE